MMPVGSVCPSTKTTISPIEGALGASSTGDAMACCVGFMVMLRFGRLHPGLVLHRNARNGVFSFIRNRALIFDPSVWCGMPSFTAAPEGGRCVHETPIAPMPFG